ncbi:hypothetical protein HHL16_06630 [Pseudoflavitalea sp. G-6-1-2]|uniref:hypothetical protein n=1 Tax=Pseudoflavitalea sp. G-6-1-2 TaxID=2728841 RepID=UPI00146F629E|nr:hypothetical protein [Pseudoflavitalea sp. G-6-1-2]NML20541.1 hypothetical protein [Pseudoflavitalea sp. G-6-1-2]
MKPLFALPLAALICTVMLFSCKKSKDAAPFNLANTQWQGEATLEQIKYGVTIEFKEEKNEVELVFVKPGAPTPFTFTGKWAKDEASVEVSFDFMKGLEKMACTATLTENNTKMANGVIKSTTQPSADPGSFSVTKK